MYVADESDFHIRSSTRIVFNVSLSIVRCTIDSCFEGTLSYELGHTHYESSKPPVVIISHSTEGITMGVDDSTTAVEDGDQRECVERNRFPHAGELELPDELAGWEKMYPEFFLFELSDDRRDYEQDQFWFWDKKDSTEPIMPWDMTISAQAWQIAMAQNTSRVFAIPPSMSVDIRVVAGYVYFSGIQVTDDELLQERAEIFEERSEYYYENYDALYNGTWLPAVKEIGNEIQSLAVPEKLPDYVSEDVITEAKGQSTQTLQVIQNYNRLTELALEGWQRHFEFLYLAYLAYMQFTETSRDLFPDISDDAIGKMVSAVEADVFRPDQELDKLARKAVELGGDVPAILKSDLKPDEKIEQLRASETGQAFMDLFEEAKDPWFYMTYGDGFHSYKGSWIDDLAAPFNHLQTKVERLESGDSLGRDFDKLQAERDAIVDEYRQYLNPDDREQFDHAYETCMSIYEYAENHQFWIENWLHTIVFRKMREFGELVVTHGLLEEPDDIFLFDRFEVAQLLEETCETWALGEGAFVTERWKDRAANRREIFEAAREWDPSPALGEPPETVSDPLMQMLWGITTEKINDWLDVESDNDDESRLDGFGSSSGQVEGRARVVTDAKDISELAEDEILVAPLTDPAWAPVFPRAKGAITDDGGITSHAAIVCREYGLPAVTGTGHATSVIETGDLVRLDGQSGEVEILEKATQS
ncbi:PEP-utilizing enzyme [Natronolimnohabitans sp. A-GB9]|uniref:PEP-utilizing enzyme n=1 Tax=Natronolimnohabitans sp. A-GB9 TaxID=3069757 RepID=UPI0027AF4AF9|nr:PEP-utilizing enzyme [Natronolimnohabitans sp. A-GB9]MDQ2052822.1 PEP-utilizing enzyme [Natronolimnohabitans sp. A-GB9]